MGEQRRRGAAGRRGQSAIESAEDHGRGNGAAFRAGDAVAGANARDGGLAEGVRRRASRDARTGDRGSGEEDRGARRELISVATTVGGPARRDAALEAAAPIGELFEREAVVD